MEIDDIIADCVMRGTVYPKCARQGLNERGKGIIGQLIRTIKHNSLEKKGLRYHFRNNCSVWWYRVHYGSRVGPTRRSGNKKMIDIK